MSTVALNSYSVGDVVKVKGQGTTLWPDAEYIVVHKGLPSDKYDASCEGVWLLRKNAPQQKSNWGLWNGTLAPYQQSEMHEYLSSVYFYNAYSQAVQALIVQAKIPVNCVDSDFNFSIGVLATRCFLLHTGETGWNSSITFPKLDYFLSGDTAEALLLRRVVDDSGIEAQCWARGIQKFNNTAISVIYTNDDGSAFSVNNDTDKNFRPAIILPYNAAVVDGVITGATVEDDGGESGGESNGVGIRVGINGLSRNIKKAYVGVPQLVLVNLLPAINGTDGWEATSGTMTSSTTYRKYSQKTVGLVGSTSLPESHICTTQSIPLIAGHKYYIRNEVYFAGANTRRTTCYWPIAEPSVYNSSSLGLSIPANTWYMLAIVSDRVAAGHSAGNYQYRVDFDNNRTSGTMYLDGCMVIDLTACFGAGNEPSQSWCNSNIPYFTGTMEFDYGNAPSKARKIIKGYIGVNNVARLMFEDQGGNT